MPGTIQISVLEFKGLPAESSPSLLKVSLGKREYQTSDMNEFSFPLTTLRGDLVVALHDAEGNELAHLGIRTMSIVEKVSWDDYFPLDGESGYLHLKLKFMLSQQEQTRIRAMREAALKEKQVFTASALSARVDVASPSSSHAEQTVSDSQTSSVLEVKKLDDSVQAGSLSNPVILYDIRQSDFAEEERSIPIKEITKDNDNREKAGSDPSGQEAEARHAKKIDTQSSIHRTPLKSGSSDKASSKQELPISIVASSSDSLNLKSVSKVKIIANAFESGLAKDVKYTVSPAAVKPVGKKFSKGGNPKEIKPTNSVEERDRISGLVAEGSKLDNVRVNNETNVDDVESQATVRSKQSTSLVIDPRADNIRTEEKGMSAANSDTLSTSETASNSGAEQSPLIVTDPMVDDMNTEETGISTGYSNSDRSLTRETASTPGKKLDCSSENVHSFDLSTKKHCSINSSNAEEKGRKDPYATKFYPSNDESILLEEYREEDNLLIDKSEAKPHQDKKISNIHGDPIKFVQHETDEEKETDSEESEDTKKPIPDSPSNDAWNGLVAQAGKFALIVGFGVLVFLTRQRQPRKTSKNEPGHNLFKPSEYMNDQVVLEAEKWIDS